MRVQCHGASKSFGPRTLWSGVDLDVDAGEVVALVGRSGSGKSTLLNCLGLLDHLDAGAILLDGHDIGRRAGESRAARQLRRRHLGYLFQNYALMENATVRQNLDVVSPSGVLLGGRRTRWREQCSAALERVGLPGRERDVVRTLSGGEQQRVALARLLVRHPPVVLADEPTGALDEDNATMVMRSLRELADDGSAVVVATHSPLVTASCDRVLDVGSYAPQAPSVTGAAMARGLLHK